MSKISKQRVKQLKTMGDHELFLKRIQKTLYYGRLPNTDRLSLPVTELASELFSEPRTGRSIDRLHCKDAAYISREACVSPCSFVLAMLYLERLKACNPEYLQCVAPSHLFLVSLMVSSKFLYDSGGDNEVIMNEWATSGGITLEELIDLERDFLSAIEWNIFVNDAAFWNKLHSLEGVVARKQSNQRGHYTYTELDLLANIEINILLQVVASVMAVLLATYTAGLLTIIGSIYITSNVPGTSLHRASSSASIEVDEYVNDDALLLNTTVYTKPMDAADVLKTGIILASIKSPENVTWDWWSSSTMRWLYESSQFIEVLKLKAIYPQFTHHYFTDMSIACWKMLDLEDQIHKGTKVRLQDRLEPSWHTEWTDSIHRVLANYIQSVKA